MGFNFVFKVLKHKISKKSKALVCCRSSAEIAGSNLARDIDVFLLRVLCVVT